MTFIQKLCSALLPRRWFAAIKAESRLWMVRCRCGFARSLWEAGGIRGKAAGTVHWLTRCPACGTRSWHRVSRERPDGGPPDGA